MTTGTPQQQAAARKGRFEAWRQRRGTLAADLAEARVNIANLNAPGALRVNDPLRPAWLEKQLTRERLALEALALHDAAGAAQHSEFLKPSSEPVALKSPDSMEIDRLNQENAALRTTVDNLRNENRRLATKLQTAKRAVGEA